jgi:hypothetical protein
LRDGMVESDYKNPTIVSAKQRYQEFMEKHREEV